MRYATERLPLPGSGERREVLLEPHVFSSFPDAVVVYWDAKAGALLRTRFDGVRLSDLRMLSALTMRGSMDLTDLAIEYGDQMSRGLRRLENAGAVTVGDSRAVVSPVEEIFAVRRLVAIEAKMHDWRGGLAQAVHNTWFAAESYLLLPTLPRGRAPYDEAERLSVGLLDESTELPAHASGCPMALRHPSVGAWLINAWASALS
jgi:hypothetical protein